MIESVSAAARPVAAVEEVFLAAAALAAKADYGTLVLDSVGTIRNCGTAAGELFGGDVADFYGLPLSSLIRDFTFSDASISFSARYLAHLCTAGGWRRFEAVDMDGRSFPIELCMSKIRTDGQDLILVNLRRPGGAA